MKRNNAKKLSALICLALTLVLAMTAIFAITASAEDGTWELVTNVSELAAGDKVIIAAKDSAVALSTTQNNNNRGQATITKNGNTVTLGSQVQELTLEEGTVSGSFAFNTGTGYLYAASSSKNYLRTEAAKSANSSWIITLAADGTATVKAQGTNTNNFMQYNKSASIFSSYSGAQQSIVIYKFHAASAPVVPDCEHVNQTTTTVNPSCTESGSITVTCDDCGTELSAETLDATGHNYVDGICANDNCGEKEPDGYVLVTDVTTLKVGDQIVIVANGYDMALGTEQASNNRKAVEIKKADGVVTFGENVEVITLEAGTKSETFAFKVDGGYLYAASSGNNYLRTETTLSDNSSWSISISGGVAAVKASGSNTRNLMQYNSSSKIFAAYGSAQQAISIYKLPAAEPEQPENPDCQHANTTTTTNPAKCESDGSTVVTCDDCGEEMSRELIPATGHINTTTTTVDPTCTTTGSVTVTCDDCGETVSTEEINKTPHAYVNGACKDCGEAEPKSLAGRYYIATIRSSGNYFYMTSDLGTASTERYQAIDSGLTALPDSIDSTTADSTQIFVLVKNSDGTYKIYAEGVSENNYLGYTSGNSGTLVAEDSALDLTVTEREDGTFNIYNNTRYLSLNGTTNNDYFAWYAGTQKQNLALIPVVDSQPEEPECTHEAKLESANVNLGKSLAVKYYVSLCDHVDAASYTMQFTMNGVTTEPVACEAEKYNGYTVFVFGGIAPQCMGDEFTAKLLCDGEEVDTHTYSILANFKNLLEDTANADNAALKQVIYDALAYGAAAQQYVGYKTDALVNDGYENDATTDATKPANSFTLSELAEGAEFSIKSAGVEFGDVNRIYVKIKNVTDVTAVEVKVGETVLEAVATSEEGVYAYYSDGISALNLDTAVEFVLCDAEGNTLQTLNYSVNTYVNRKWDDDNMMNLVRALYNYGESAKAYASN